MNSKLDSAIGKNEAIILGSGTSNGVPMLGYQYPEGYFDNPKNRRNRASLLLKGPEGNVLIDCPPEMRLQLTGAGIDDIDCVIISHTHADHIMGMDDLRSICLIREKVMPIYTLEEHAADIRRVFPYAFVTPPPGIAYPRFELFEIPEVLERAGLKLTLFWVWHGKTRVVGVRVNGLAYITDVSFVPEEALTCLRELDTLIVDGLRFKPHPNHFNLEQALEFSAMVGPKRTILTHLTHDYDHDVTNAQLPTGVELAYDEMKVNF